MENGIQVIPEEQHLSVAKVKEHIDFVKTIMRDVLKEGKVENGKIVKDGHYGKLPGCGDKDVLLKAGAEKLCLAFNLVPRYQINIMPIPQDEITPPGHRDYDVTCELFNRHNGNFVGQGMACCTTMEGKYRFRSKYKDRKYIGKEENPCIADIYNTVKKMACKRAIVHAVIQALAVGDIFMQDVEDMDPKDMGNGNSKPDMAPPQSKSSGKTKMASAPQCGKIHALMNGMMDKDTPENVKHQYVAALIEKESLESYKALTSTEASTVIKKLMEESANGSDEKAPF